MKTVCISLGGSVVSKPFGLNIAYLKDFTRLLEKHTEKKFIVITGGGATSQAYIDALRKEGASEFELDEIGIAFTRINAIALLSFFKSSEVYPSVVGSIEELKRAHSQSRITISGGYLPGITTDAVAVLAAEAVHSSLVINVSTEPYLYTLPPKDKGAKKLKRIGYDGLIALAAKYDDRTAKSNFLFDLVASKLAKRSNIRIDFIGESIQELDKAINGSRHKGTVVSK